jgi:hypothetical protein
MPIQSITPTFSAWNGWSPRNGPPTFRQVQTNMRTDLNNLGNSVRDDIENNPPTLGNVIDVLV